MIDDDLKSSCYTGFAKYASLVLLATYMMAVMYLQLAFYVVFEVEILHRREARVRIKCSLFLVLRSMYVVVRTTVCLNSNTRTSVNQLSDNYTVPVSTPTTYS